MIIWQAIPNWQPIETAPKDGTHILVYTPAAPESSPRFGAPEWIGEVMWADMLFGGFGEMKAEGKRGTCYGWCLANSMDGEMGGYSTVDELPTHWLPLPAPPTVK